MCASCSGGQEIQRLQGTAVLCGKRESDALWACTLYTLETRGFPTVSCVKLIRAGRRMDKLGRGLSSSAEGLDELQLHLQQGTAYEFAS
jgi:hypothetical protein